MEKRKKLISFGNQTFEYLDPKIWNGLLKQDTWGLKLKWVQVIIKDPYFQGLGKVDSSCAYF